MSGEYKEIESELDQIRKSALNIARASETLGKLNTALAQQHYEPRVKLTLVPDEPRPLVKLRPWSRCPDWLIGIEYANRAVRDGEGYASFTAEEARELYLFLRPIFEPREEVNHGQVGGIPGREPEEVLAGSGGTGGDRRA